VVAWRRQLDDAAETNTAVDIQFTTASRSAGVEFDDAVRRALHEAAGRDAPELVCFAGHDAGILAERRPAGMVFVRNPTGVSHSPHEHVDLEDAAAAATVMLRAVEKLAATP
jgi:N-carbamoyl-L-amino-acid hydrolase